MPMPFAIHDIRADAALPAEWCLELGVVVGMSRFHVVDSCTIIAHITVATPFDSATRN